MVELKPILIVIICLSIISNILTVLNFILTTEQKKILEDKIDDFTLWIDEKSKFPYLLNLYIQNLLNGKLLFFTWIVIICLSIIIGYYSQGYANTENRKFIIGFYFLAYVSIFPGACINNKMTNALISNNKKKYYKLVLLILPIDFILKLFFLFCALMFSAEFALFFNIKNGNYLIIFLLYIVSLIILIAFTLFFTVIEFLTLLIMLNLMQFFLFIISKIFWRITMYEEGYIKGIIVFGSFLLTTILIILIYLFGYN